MTYSEKLKSPKWQKKRLQILERDGWRCLSCGSSEKNLQVHHVVYSKHTEPWDYDDKCYQTLCCDCHEERQEIGDKAANAIRIAIKDFPTPRMESVAVRIIKTAMEGLE